MSKPTPADVRAIHGRALAHAKVAKDSKGNGNDDPALVAFNATRSDVHAALQAESPPPGPHPDDDGDPEMLHMRQKAHFKKLWKEADALVAAAGVTEKGVV
jgi:hypothetical protein